MSSPPRKAANTLVQMDPDQISVSRDDAGVQFVLVRGEHDLYTAPTLRETITGLIADAEPVIVDLTPATFIDSSILGVLLGGLRRARERGHGFAVLVGDEAEPTVRRIFEVTGLLPVFPVYSARADAITAVLGPREG